MMGIFEKLAFQGLIKSKTRALVTIIGVILSATMITAVASFAISLQNYMIRGATQKYGSWHIAIEDKAPDFAQECAKK